MVRPLSLIRLLFFPAQSDSGSDFSATMLAIGNHSQREGHVLHTEIKRTDILFGAWAMSGVLGLF
jgi:hypothetical protein